MLPFEMVCEGTTEECVVPGKALEAIGGIGGPDQPVISWGSLNGELQQQVVVIPDDAIGEMKLLDAVLGIELLLNDSH